MGLEPTGAIILAPGGFTLAGRWCVAAALIVSGLTAVAQGATPAHGVSFVVNSTADAVDASAGDGACADTTGACTLRAAVLEANALPGADAVSVPAGTYRLTIPGGINPYPSGAVGAISITDHLSISGAGPGATIIDGGNYEGGVMVKMNPVFYVTGIAPAGQAPTVDIQGLTVQGGLANLSGGGILNSGNLTIRNMLIRDNQASQFGGGGISNDGQLTVIDSVIFSNGAQTGGGISNYGSMTVTNTTISENTGVDHGGGVYSWGSATLINVTVQGNGSKEAGGVGGGTNVAIKNTIVSDNGIISNCVSPLTSLGHNISSDASCGLSGPGDMNSVDPLLGPLADNGGPTQTQALSEGSPAIDTGDNEGCPPTDQRGVARPQNRICDIGAYEYVPPVTPSPPPAVITASPSPAPTAVPDSPTPTLMPSPSAKSTPSRTPRPSRTPPSARSEFANDDDSGRGGLILPLMLGGFAAAALSGGGAYYLWRRRANGQTAA